MLISKINVEAAAGDYRGYIGREEISKSAINRSQRSGFYKIATNLANLIITQHMFNITNTHFIDKG